MCILFRRAKEKVKKRFTPTAVVFLKKAEIFSLSGINISIIEPSRFWCCHVTAPTVFDSHIRQVAVLANKFSSTKVPKNILPRFSIFHKNILLLLLQTERESFPTTNICFASNFLVFQEAPKDFQSKLIRQRRKFDEGRKIVLTLK